MLDSGELERVERRGRVSEIVMGGAAWALDLGRDDPELEINDVNTVTRVGH